MEVTDEIPAHANGELFFDGPDDYDVTHKNGEVTHINLWCDDIKVMHRFAVDGASGTVMCENRCTGCCAGTNGSRAVEGVVATRIRAVVKWATSSKCGADFCAPRPIVSVCHWCGCTRSAPRRHTDYNRGRHGNVRAWRGRPRHLPVHGLYLRSWSTQNTMYSSARRR